ncbi:hypothetical protein KK141_04950 [Dyella sp. LX-66]|uniref:hypothetical protein n=1 Tax=unclassified Dyella TaxID=2634549 RepID=UPI001BE09DAD|nr:MULTISPECIES: hypothetical protein [unclassified Dyella]MBT2116934.1 hypothetical protein [Dyella sp. LX-1]MBT2138886.1 hypothetical protein [Dyella sp. LX-66]
MTFVLGTVFTPLSLSEYFSSPTTWRYLLSNATTYRIAGDLPGVTLRDGAFADVINGSLWTILVKAPAMALKQRIARKPLEPVAGEAAS